jgi:hypothetical protein
MPLATAITSRAGGRSLAMALRTQNFVGHFLLPPVSPHEDMGRDAISTTRLMSRAAANVRETAKQAQLALDCHTFRKFHTICQGVLRRSSEASFGPGVASSPSLFNPRKQRRFKFERNYETKMLE